MANNLVAILWVCWLSWCCKDVSYSLRACGGSLRRSSEVHSALYELRYCRAMVFHSSQLLDSYFRVETTCLRCLYQSVKCPDRGDFACLVFHAGPICFLSLASLVRITWPWCRVILSSFGWRNFISQILLLSSPEFKIEWCIWIWRISSGFRCDRPLLDT